jgi:hypothetical protein
MAIRKLDRSFAPTVKEIRYLNKTFPQFRQSLIDFAKVYFPNTYSDFNETSPGMMFIEMASYVGDVLSYYIDSQYRENLLQYAEERANIIAIAQAFGYKPKPVAAAFADVDMYQLCPAGDAGTNFEPDPRYFLKLSPNTVVSAPEFGGKLFRTIAETSFADPINREITIYSVNSNAEPLTYLVRKTVRVTAGEIKTFTATFNDPSKFSKIILPDTDVIEVLSVTDSNGYDWHEVDYLAQDLVFVDVDNSSAEESSGESVPPTYLIKVTRVPRRFTTRYDEDFKLELHFGSGTAGEFDDLVNLDPSKIANDEYQQNLASTSLDPSDFLSSRSYGLAPANAEFIITYVIGGGLSSNVPSNSINKLMTVTVTNDKSSLSPAELALFNDVVTSLAVNNPAPATGGKDADSVEEIRQNALAFFNSQNRLVNTQDYVVRAYAMPPKYGAPAKVFVIQDAQINNLLRANLENIPIDGNFVVDNAGQNKINFYVLGFDNNKKLSTLNLDVKKNLRTYLDQYRILTDELRILDGFVVNIAVEFDVVVFKNYNLNEVLARCIDSMKNFFDIDRWQMNQPIILADVYSELATVDGVQSVTSVKVSNKYSFRDGADYNDYLYDIHAATVNGIIYPSLDPCIFEIRYPDNDIIGNGTQ